ncbi:glycine zipper domain-containing protein [Pseudomonas sp. UBA1879]|uniref:glycine zipper domain-containing protein n=1 Tax=Pseudomonas sp. UBA1879 TaxID=1947305 RepID=UPI0025FF5BC9|nr:hypothetical protein [Pseudomonas sp. UBA1879]
MSKLTDTLTETLSEDLYAKTRAQLNTFINETNALLAAGDALHEDRTNVARDRLVAFLKEAALRGESVTEGDVLPIEPPVTRALNEAKGFVRANPWAAVATAAGVGLVVSLLLNRRQR